MLDRIRQAKIAMRCAVLCVAACYLAACGGGEDSPVAYSAPPSATGGTPPSSTTTSIKLTLSGKPAGSVEVGSAYSFQPTVSQSTGTVQFSITGNPSWAAFDTATGALSGTPSSADVGTTGAITITASDSGSTSSIGPFTIEVTALPADPPPSSGAGTATLKWAAPTKNSDGTPVSELAGYIIRYGTSVDAMDQTITVSSAATTSYEISNLAAGTYYFEVIAYSSDGTQGAASNVGGVAI